FRMFGANPAPTWRAKEFLFDHIHEGAIVVDGHDTIVEINQTGAAILGVDADRALGASASELLPVSGPIQADGGRDFLTVGTESTSQSYDVTMTELTDRRDHTLGYVFTLHNVTRYLQQQQRLKVLNRVLRHNIRTEANIIQGYAERTADETAKTIKRRTMRIVELSEKGRDAIDLFEDAVGEWNQSSLDSLVADCLAGARDAFPDVAFELDRPTEDAPVPDGAAVVVNNLIENAAVHNVGSDRRVSVSAWIEGDQAVVQITDNGPGIDEYELDILDSGTETPLRHGSGLGLWLVKWGTETIGGSVDFEPAEPTGTIATVTVPLSGSDGRTPAPRDG
ncbi:PAS domain-containing protein, partial [Halorubrum sp. SD626R]|uniref:sensor histidine kinase n=1 Tax=Halorubrum sp. SD626R TaxID=1419722 RepID=UPI0010F76A3D